MSSEELKAAAAAEAGGVLQPLAPKLVGCGADQGSVGRVTAGAAVADPQATARRITVKPRKRLGGGGAPG